MFADFRESLSALLPPAAPATVSLVGAGPGDPMLITLAGAVRIAQADTVVCDSLIDERLLSLAGPEAERLHVGKRGGGAQTPQADINALLIDRARHGRRVVRLKGGDPYVFGRGAEEAAALESAGVGFEVVSGVTAAVAASAASGIPLTHREFGSTLALATGHEDPAKPDTAVDYAALARMGTVVFYMSVRTLESNCRRLIDAGMDPATPAAAIEWGATPRQRTLAATLADLPREAQRRKLTAPALVVIGPVVSLRETLNAFERRPLFGRRIVVTRSRSQASDLSRRLAAHGAEVLEAPTIRIDPPPDWRAVDDALREVGAWDWLVLTSANGVRAMWDRLVALGHDARHLAGVKIAAIGQATDEALQQCGLRADRLPERFTSEALADALCTAGKVSDRRILLLRADIAGEALTQRLTDAGAECRDVAAYRTSRPESLPPEVLDAMEAGRVDWITFTSSSTVTNFLALLPDRLDERLSSIRLASIGPVTSRTLRKAGLSPTVEADPHTIDALADTICAAS